MSPQQSHPAYLLQLLTGVLCNSHAWCTTLSRQMLGVLTWCQVTVLFWYDCWSVCGTTSKREFQVILRFIHHLVPPLTFRCCQWYRSLG